MSPGESTPAQQRAIDAEGNVLVLAGAGTGKTRVMVERCLKRVGDPASGTGMDRILMVTFTEAAAAEMKHRIRSRLGQLARSWKGKARAHIREQLALVDAAAIGTLHAIALRLLQEHASVLGLPPRVQVLSPPELFPLRSRALDQTLEACYADPRRKDLARWIRLANQGAPDRALSPGSRSHSVRRLILRLHDHLQSLPFPGKWLDLQRERYSSPEPEAWRLWLAERFDALFRRPWIASLRSLLDGAPPKKRQDLEDRIGALEEMGSDPLEGRGHLERATRSAPAGSGHPFGEMRFLERLLRDPGSGSSAMAGDWRLCSSWIFSLSELARAFGERFALLKRQRQGIDYPDMEQLALRLLYPEGPDRGCGRIARRLQERFRLVFVDEYQDINPAQDAIVSALSRPEGNRFIVGDAKQSIYGFRQARPRILEGYQERWPNSAIHLRDNFRSRPALLRFFNRFFSRLGREVPGFDYGGEAELVPGAGGAGGSEARVSLHLAVQDGSRKRERVESEAHVLARAIGDWVRKGGPGIAGRDGGAPRKASWRDFAILARSHRNCASAFARAFSQHRIPLSSGGDSFHDLPVVRDLTALLRTMDNPLGSVPLLAVLRSPLVGMDADQLAMLRLSDPEGSLWDALRILADSSDEERAGARARAGRFLERHRRWQEDRRSLAPSECLDRFLAGLPESRFPDRNSDPQVRQFFQLLEGYEEEHAPDLSQMVQWLRHRQEESGSAEPSGSDSVDAVRLMTIHRSKGLEFPVVALARIDERFNQEGLGAPLILDDDLGLCPMLSLPGASGTCPSLPHLMGRSRLKRSLAAEEARLLYVAMTRAREHLILSGSFRSQEEIRRPGGPSYAGWILPWARESAGLGREGEEEGEAGGIRWKVHLDPPSRTGSGGQERPRAPAPDPDRWTYPYRLAAALPRSGSASSLRKQDPPFLPGEPGPADPAVSPVRKGLAYHQVLELLDPDRALSVESVLKACNELAAGGRISQAQLGLLDPGAIARFWNSETGERIRRSRRWIRRELPFEAAFSARELSRLGFDSIEFDGATAGEVAIVSGIVDLAVIRKEEIWILDYKTDRVGSREGIAARIRHHAPQVGLYRAAMERIYGRPVTQAWIHFLDAGATEAVPPPGEAGPEPGADGADAA